MLDGLTAGDSGSAILWGVTSRAVASLFGRRVCSRRDAVVTMEGFTTEVTFVEFVTFEWVADSIPPDCQPERSLEPRRDSTNVLRVPRFGICGVLPRTKAVWVRDTEAPGNH